jgi:hypothetical protein
MNKVGLFITTMIHEITQARYSVSFNRDFRGMVRIDFKNDHDPEFYDHDHCGVPGGSREKLEKDIIQALNRFKTKYLIQEEGDTDGQA